MQIHMQCDNGEIEVFLCPEEENASNHCSGASSSEELTDTESEASPMKPLHLMSVGGRAHPPSPPPRLDLDEESRSSDIGQIRNVLISASEDFGPVGQKLQLQTLDQDNGEQIIQHNVSWEGFREEKKRKNEEDDSKPCRSASRSCLCDSRSRPFEVVYHSSSTVWPA